jgi:hypothetical protein
LSGFLEIGRCYYGVRKVSLQLIRSRN